MSTCSKLVGDRSNKSGAIACRVRSPPPVLLPSSPSRKTIEDVWRDISQSFLRDHHDPISVSGTILRDFMLGPFRRSPTFTGVRESSPAAAAVAGAPFDSPATPLSLNSGRHGATKPPAPYVDVDRSSGLSPYCGKRGPETRDEPWDRRHKRLIKNRESASRSRARRQAYTTELEMELERLKQENAKLRKQQEGLILSSSPASDDKVSKTNGLYRNLTSPF